MSARRAAATLTALLVLTLAPAAAWAQSEDWPEPIHDDQLFWFVLGDQIEVVSTGEDTLLAWDVEGWIGGDFNRVWLKLEGERLGGPGRGEFEVQALYSRLVSPFWEMQAGLRVDRTFGPGEGRTRAHLAFGMQGLAPYWFELEPTIFLSEDGDLSARLTASYDLLLSQRLVLQPFFEINVAAQTVQEWGVGSGLSDLTAELRLRYEIERELAPYLGVGWTERFGRSAELARAAGEHVVELGVRGGVRIWF